MNNYVPRGSDLMTTILVYGIKICCCFILHYFHLDLETKLLKLILNIVSWCCPF